MCEPLGTTLCKEKSDRVINNNDKYYNVDKKYLAESLSFLNFRFYKFNYGDETIYSFENTEKFKKALKGLLDLKRTINKL